MPLLLLDLDNTLIDRAAAFRRWAVRFTAAVGAPPCEADWLVSEDRDGLQPRARLAASIRERFGLAGRDEEDVLEELRRGLVDDIELDPAIPRSLDHARAAGWVPVVVTNGTVFQQERKLRRTGLDRHLAGWVISEGAGVRKPEPLIFRLAARQCSADLAGAWMIGDSADADVRGAHQVGLRSIWLHRHRAWTAPDFAPTHVMDTCARAITAVVTGRFP